MALFPSLPENAGLGDLLARHPGGMRPLMEWLDALLRGPSELTIGERELIAAYVSGLNACTFCHSSHLLYAELFGIAPGKLEALLEAPEKAPFGARLRPLLAYVEKLTRLPARLGQADVDAVLAAGWSEAALFDAVKICGAFSLMNRLVEGAGIRFDYATDPDALPNRDDPARHAHTYLDFANRLGL
ncbi:MAG TPA: peroxidase [Aliiroseovarius sp.]|nr:peroxidase [Aliiroseovarius sp.]